ncbi:dihydroxyacetone kinase subunit DhaL [Kribbella catacumbae]|uniref:dihydroxyacetone kinase subunit DhaL n=1 Tax=Kribbella catacumbae TaxID=460086 RepID=UPI0003616A00|nr:dihydroxyacetone kinase subunit DhaL [Kribbella catacumbae]
MSDTITVELLSRWIHEFSGLVSAHHDQLNSLDAAIGDADHGTNLDRGFTVVAAGLATAPQQPGDLLSHVGRTVVSKVGGAAGPLFGSFFLCLGDAIGNDPDLDSRRFALGLRAGLAGVVARGRAEAGDKTLYDVLAPGVDAIDAAAAAQYDLPDVFRAGLLAAEAGRESTICMLARKGRASYLGERSVGHQDPGATSACLLFTAATSAAT